MKLFALFMLFAFNAHASHVSDYPATWVAAVNVSSTNDTVYEVVRKVTHINTYIGDSIQVTYQECTRVKADQTLHDCRSDWYKLDHSYYVEWASKTTASFVSAGSLDMDSVFNDSMEDKLASFPAEPRLYLSQSRCAHETAYGYSPSSPPCVPGTPAP